LSATRAFAPEQTSVAAADGGSSGIRLQSLRRREGDFSTR
jgi:hypothetical protein